MTDQSMTNTELLEEISALEKRIQEMEQSDSGPNRMDEANFYSKRLAVLTETGLSLTSELNLDVLLDSIVERALKLIGGEHCNCFLYRPESNLIERVAYAGLLLSLGNTTRRCGESFVGQVWSTGGPLLVNDYHSWEGRKREYDTLPPRALMGVPIRWGEEFLGVLNVAALLPHEFTQTDMDVLSLFATQAAIAIRNARLFDKLKLELAERKRTEGELSAIVEIGRVISSTLDIGTVYEQFATITRKLIPFDTLSVNLIDAPKNLFRNAYFFGLDLPGRWVGLEVPLAGSMTGYVTLRRKAAIFAASSVDEMAHLYPEVTKNLSMQAGFHSNMLIPLFSNDAVIGVLHFRAKKQNVYTEADLRLAERIGMQVAGAIINAKLFNDLSKTEKSLRESEARYRLIAENTGDLILTLDMNLRFTYVSPASVRLHGFTAEETMEQTLEQVLTPESLKVALTVFEEEMQLEHNGTADPARTRILELEVYKKDGSTIWVEASISFLHAKNGNPTEIIVVCRDITERKRAEEALQLQEMQLRTILESTGDGILAVDNAGKVIKTNQRFADLWNIPPDLFKKGSDEALLAQVLDQLVAPDAFLEKVHALYASTIVDFDTIPFKDGRIMERYSCPLMSEGIVNGRVWSFRDVTDRKRAEKALRESEHKYRLLFEMANDGIFLQGKTGFVDCNEKGASMYGLLKEDVIGRSPAELCPTIQPDGRLSADVAAEKMMAALNGSPQNFEWQALRADGVPLDVEITLNRVETGGSFLLLAIVRDITERKQAEKKNRILTERLQRSEKMEALGQLAGGVAHDLNNVLGILSGYSELLLEEIPEGQRSRGHAEKILQSTEKGAAIIQDLLTLARRGVTIADVINLNAIVSGFLRTPVFEKLKDYHPRVNFRIECEKNLPNIKGSPVHLEKTLMNLASNAAEAISGTGEVTIRTESRYLDKPLRGYDEITEGDYAVLTVSDTGTGIPVQDREKIFEPFYTKKTMGRSGTGLGLTIVWGTVKDHSGYIDLQTKVGQGTTFTLYFPATREELFVQKQKTPTDQYRGKGESVLVVDDIAEQRDVAARLLTRLGYEVHEAPSGEEAVEYLKGNKADILVLDMIMAPGIDGLETYRNVLKIHPKQKAILVSGFSETDRVREAQKLGAGIYVKKPYVMEKIGMAIREELAKK